MFFSEKKLIDKMLLVNNLSTIKKCVPLQLKKSHRRKKPKLVFFIHLDFQSRVFSKQPTGFLPLWSQSIFLYFSKHTQFRQFCFCSQKLKLDKVESPKGYKQFCRYFIQTHFCSNYQLLQQRLNRNISTCKR